jgi:hypothetical protein
MAGIIYSGQQGYSYNLPKHGLFLSEYPLNSVLRRV